jgi:hypothetical protein
MVTITKQGDCIFLNFFNSKEVYSIKRFDTERKAKNYATKWGYELVEELPEFVSEFTYND